MQQDCWALHLRPFVRLLYSWLATTIILLDIHDVLKTVFDYQETCSVQMYIQHCTVLKTCLFESGHSFLPPLSGDSWEESMKKKMICNTLWYFVFSWFNRIYIGPGILWAHSISYMTQVFLFDALRTGVIEALRPVLSSAAVTKVGNLVRSSKNHGMGNAQRDTQRDTPIGFQPGVSEQTTYPVSRPDECSHVINVPCAQFAAKFDGYYSYLWWFVVSIWFDCWVLDTHGHTWFRLCMIAEKTRLKAQVLVGWDRFFLHFRQQKTSSDWYLYSL